MISTHWRKPHQPELNDFSLFDVLARQAADLIDRNQAEAVLRANERFSRALVEGVPQLVWRADAEGQWTWASPQWTAFTGQAESDSHGLGWLDPIHPNDRADVMAVWAEAGSRGEFHSDYRIRNAQEQRDSWFQTRATPVRDDGGRIVEWLGTSTDVDDIRQMQERQRVLVGELQHRVRNIMTITRNIAARSGERAESVEEYMQLVAGRLMALARVQSLLTRDPGVRAGLRTIVRDEISAKASQDGQFTIEGPDLALAPKTAEVLTLVVHELETNALKYGALAAPGGTIAVRWATSEREGTPWLTFEWIESGVPGTPHAIGPRRRGFGSELVEGRVPYELGGKGAIDIRPEGAHCRLECPLGSGASVLETSAPRQASVYGGALDMGDDVDLGGHRVLVVEDEYYIATDAARALRGAGAVVVGPVPTETAASAEVERQRPDAVVVDINLGGGASFALAESLKERGIPFMFVTGYDEDVIPPEFDGIERLQKPVELRQMIDAVSRLVGP